MQRRCLVPSALDYGKTRCSLIRPILTNAPSTVPTWNGQLSIASLDLVRPEIERLGRELRFRRRDDGTRNKDGYEYLNTCGQQGHLERSPMCLNRLAKCLKHLQFARDDDVALSSLKPLYFFPSRSNAAFDNGVAQRSFHALLGYSTATISLRRASGFWRSLHASTYNSTGRTPESSPPHFQVNGRDRVLHLHLDDTNDREPIRQHLAAWQEKYTKDNPQLLLKLSELGMVPRETNSLLNFDGRTTEEVENEDDEDLDFDDETYEREYESSKQHRLKRGDLVQIAGPNESPEGFFAVFLRARTEILCDLYTIRGEHSIKKLRMINFTSKDRVPLDLVDPIIRYLPDLDDSSDHQDLERVIIPSEVGAAAIDFMIRFTEECEDVYRKHATKLDDPHQLLSYEHDVKYMSLKDMAEVLLGVPKEDVNDAGFCVVEQSIRRVSSAISRIGWGLGRDVLYHVRSRRQMRSIDAVVAWVRQYQEATVKSASPNANERAAVYRPLVQFIAKARRLISKSRKLRSATTMGSLGPTSKRYTPDQTDDGLVYQKLPGEAFSETDRIIISFLHSWVATRSWKGDQKVLKAVATTILRAIGCYEDIPLTADIGRLVLQELGIYTPWENVTIFSKPVDIPGHGMLAVSDKLLHDVRSLSSSLDTLNLVDSMQDLRRDWGDLDVFCVDDEHSAEVDDGVSVEAMPGFENQFWVHIHVANPSAFFRPDHPFAQYAAHITTSLYLPERTYPMLPSELTQNYWSLAPDRPVMTFSALLNQDGDILDHKITPGIVRKVIHITPRQVDEILGRADRNPDAPFITVGGKMGEGTTISPQVSISEAQLQALRLLEDLRSAHLGKRNRQREASNVPELFQAQRKIFPEIRLNAGRKPLPRSVLDFRQSYHYQGDPIVQLRRPNRKPFETHPEMKDFVETFMILGGEIGARWCAERNIPTLFRGALYSPDEMMGNSREGRQFQPRVAPKAITSSTPQMHHMLGIDKYCKCTSPLRRYSDLITHWQIEAALRQESSQYKPITESQPISCLPFSANDIDNKISWIVPMEGDMKYIERASKMHWAMQCMLRAFHFQETALPDTIQVIISEIFSSKIHRVKGLGIGEPRFHGHALPWYVPVVIVVPKDSVADFNVNDVIETKLKLVDPHEYHVFVQPVHLVKRAENRNLGQESTSNLAHDLSV